MLVFPGRSKRLILLAGNDVFNLGLDIVENILRFLKRRIAGQVFRRILRHIDEQFVDGSFDGRGIVLSVLKKAVFLPCPYFVHLVAVVPHPLLGLEISFRRAVLDVFSVGLGYKRVLADRVIGITRPDIDVRTVPGGLCILELISHFPAEGVGVLTDGLHLRDRDACLRPADQKGKERTH